MAKILIVKLGAIGDVIMTLPILYRAKLDACEVHWVTGQTTAPILMRVRDIDRLFIVNDKKLLKGKIHEKAFEFIKIWSKLLFKSYNRVIIPYQDRRYRLITLTTLSLHTARFNSGVREEAFVKDRLMSLEILKLYTGIDDYRMVNYPLPDFEVTKVKAEIYKEISGCQKKVVIAPGGAKNLMNSDDVRRYPLGSYNKVISSLNKMGITPIIVGNNDDNYVLESFVGNTYVNLIGKTSLNQLLALLNISNVLITHDTGILHLAKLTKVNVIALFGPVHPYSRIEKNDKKFHIFWAGKDLPCSPCYDGKGFAKCVNNICLRKIDPENIVRKVSELLVSKN